MSDAKSCSRPYYSEEMRLRSLAFQEICPPTWAELFEKAKDMPASQVISLCPICHKDLKPGYVARAGYEPDDLRAIPPKFGRGQYCDHIPDPRLQD